MWMIRSCLLHAACLALGLVGPWALAAPARAMPAVRPLLALGDRSAVELEPFCHSWIDRHGSQSAAGLLAAGPAVAWVPCSRQPRERLHAGAAHWLRFTVQAREPGSWLLDLGSADFDRAELFHRGADGRWQSQRAGARVPLDQWPLPGRAPAFPLPTRPGEPVTFWLRLEHSRLHFAAAQVIRSQASLASVRQREQFLLGGYAGIAALVILAALVAAVRLRDRAFLAFSAFVALLALGQLARLGVTGQHLWPHATAWNQAGRFLLPGAATAAALWFVRTVTEPARRSPALDRTTLAVLAGLLAATALDAWLGTPASLAGLLTVTSVALPFIGVLVVWAWLHGREASLRLFALGWLPLLVLSLFPLARALDLLEPSFLTRYGIFAGALLEMPVLYHVLTVRALRRRESQERAAALAHTDPLTGLALRAPLLERLEASLTRARSQKQHGALLAVNIANLQALQATHGREAAQKAIVVAASHLVRATTDADFVARVGEHEFAALLEAPVTPAQALSKAQQVVASGLRPVQALPHGATLRLHVAVAMLPYEQLDGALTLQCALDALAQMPPDTRKMIRPLDAQRTPRGIRPRTAAGA